jgi:AsmA protein
VKKLLYVVLGIVAIFAIATVFLFLLFKPNDFREEISAEVARVTGRDLVIEGDLELSFFPWLAIEIGETRLGNAAGFGDEPFASFSQARLSVRVLPLLLRREVSVGVAAIDSLHLNLAVDRNGRTNWQDLVEAGEAEPEAAPTEGEPSGDLDIAGIGISNATVNYSDAQLGESYSLTNLSLSTGRIAAGAPVDFSGEFDFELQPADLAGDFSIDAVMSLDAEANKVGFSNVDINVLGIDVAAEVEPFSYAGDLAPVATLEVEAFSLKSLMQRLNIEPLETADSEALEKVILSATARVTPAATILDELNLVIDDTTFTGQLSIASDAAGTIGIELAGDSMDLDRYMAPAVETEGAAQDEVPVEIPAELIRSLNVRGNLTLEEAGMSGMTFEQVELGINAANGRLRMHPITAQFFDGTYDGDVNINASGDVPVLSVNENVRDVNVGSLAKAMFEQEDVTGTINGSFQLSGSGADFAVIQRNLAGNMSFELLDGAWEGTDVWYELRRARALLKKEPEPEPQLPARTEFSSVTLTGPVTDGVFKNDDLMAELPFMQLTGKGTVDFAEAEIDYRLSARILKKPEFLQDATEDELEDFTEAVIPLRITGPLAEPSIKPDVEAMLKKEAEKQLKDALRDKLLGGSDAEEEAETGEEATGEEPKKKKDRDRLKDALKDLLDN